MESKRSLEKKPNKYEQMIDRIELIRQSIRLAPVCSGLIVRSETFKKEMFDTYIEPLNRNFIQFKFLVEEYKNDLEDAEILSDAQNDIRERLLVVKGELVERALVVHNSFTDYLTEVPADVTSFVSEKNREAQQRFQYLLRTVLNILELLPNQENLSQIDAILRTIHSLAPNIAISPYTLVKGSAELQAELLQDEWISLLPDEATDEENDSHLDKLLTIMMLDSMQEKWGKTKIALQRGLVRHIGPVADRMFESWQTEKDGVAVIRELSMFAQVWRRFGREKMMRLVKDYGITSFRSIPSDILSSQANFNEQGDLNKQIIIVFLPFSDHNGALRGLGPVLSDLYDNVFKTHNIVCAQIKHQYEVYRCLSRVRKDYGSDQNNYQADHLIVMVHGSKDRLLFGPSESDVITAEKIKEFGRTHTADAILKKEAQVLLVSCSTGQSGGIGETIAMTYGRSVQAPDKPTNVISFVVNYTSDGKLSLTPQYLAEDSHQTFNPQVHN